ncbi:hypothetical protein TNCV_1996951 [Trichonephila clavipes]|uniref:Uncharacterized protein n=1 Tax=Trichonephila clavipes TaxID=2585209 RepID=A0A8X6V754_TRICX|nr:hypothetical protein TNCV_1996951 [Trichonephila clavipes]
METCGVPNAAALRPLFSVYRTYGLYLLQFACFLKSLHDAFPKQCFQELFAVYHKCSLLNPAQIAGTWTTSLAMVLTVRTQKALAAFIPFWLYSFTNSAQTFTGRFIPSACWSSRLKNQH